MKIPHRVAIPLLMAATEALAFQARDKSDLNQGYRSSRESVSTIVMAYHRQPGVTGAAALSGICSSLALAGCGCAFCRLLRQQSS